MDLVDSFLATLSSEQTKRAYATDLRNFFQSDEVEESVVSAVDAQTVQSEIRTIYRNQASLATQRRRLAALRSFFDWLIRKEALSSNPARHPDVKTIDTEKNPTPAPRLSKNDLESLVAAADEDPATGPRDVAIILTIVYAALRRSEVTYLEVDDVRPLGRHWILDLRNDRSGSSYVRIPKVVVEAIETVKDVYDITSGRLWRSLSPQNRGEPMSPDAVYKMVRRVSSKAGLGSVSIEVLRKSGLQMALRGGASLPHVQAHGRLQDAASAASLHPDSDRPGTLDESAVEFIELDVSDQV